MDSEMLKVTEEDFEVLVERLSLANLKEEKMTRNFEWEAEVGLDFSIHDLWIGLFWTYTQGLDVRWYNIYICILPAFPIHIKITVPNKEDE